jgi:hypothetical protein
MATNFIQVNQMLAKNSLKSMVNRLVFLKTVNRQLDSQWGANFNGFAPGTSYKINRPARFKSQKGNLIGQFNPVTGDWTTQSFTEDPVFLTVSPGADQLNIPVSFDSSEITLALTDEKTRIAAPIGAQLANDLERKILVESALVGGNYVLAAGNAGLGIKIGTADLLQAQATLDALTAPQGERSCLIPAFSMAQLSRENLNLFTPTINEGVYPSGYIKEFAGSDMYSYNLLPVYSVPQLAAATYAVQSAVVNGASTVSVTFGAGDAGKVLKAGTIIEFPGFSVVNPATRESIGKSYSFALKSDVTLINGANVLTIDDAAKIYYSSDTGNRQNIAGAFESFSFSATLTSGSATIPFAGAAAGMVGYGISGTGIPGGATVISAVPGTSITISANATASGAQVLTLGSLAQIPAGALVSVVGASTSAARSYDQVVMYHKEALTATVIPLTKDLPGAYAARADFEGLSVRTAVQTVVGSDTVVHRFDVYGKGILCRDQHVVRVLVPKF